MPRPLGLTYLTDAKFAQAAKRFRDSITALRRKELQRTAQRRNKAAIQRLWEDVWRDTRGGILSLELLIVGSVLGIGCIAGLSSVRNAIVAELRNVSAQIQQIEHFEATPEEETEIDPIVTRSLPTEGTCLVVCGAVLTQE